ncbi:MAG TPA: gamma-glutamyltransferase [Reyranella sp.]|nr:gamma-glutamyltransferase [Reyranella sp.]
MAALAVFMVSACGGNTSEDPYAKVSDASGARPQRAGVGAMFDLDARFAAVAADESMAAEVGRDVLQAGGNAIDAAVAMYFAMAVTYPSAAGLGASGACIVHDAKKNMGEVFAFAPIPAPGPIRGITFNVPSGVRAITLMHIRHGYHRWEADVAPAERLARVGVPVSHALGRDLQAGGNLLDGDSEARRVFGRGTGRMLGERDIWAPAELASTLAAIRQRGGTEMFQGNLARLMSDQIAQMGGSLPLESLRSAIPQTGAPISVADGGFNVYAAPSPLAGPMALAGWKGEPAPSSEVPTNSNGISGFAAIDDGGNAAACSLSMGQLFGARIMVPGTGVLLGAVTPAAASVSPIVIGNTHNGEVKFAGAGGGSPYAPYATGAIARLTSSRTVSMAQALTTQGGRGGYVSAIACPDGIKSSANHCSTATDPAGAGLAIVAIQK